MKIRTSFFALVVAALFACAALAPAAPPKAGTPKTKVTTQKQKPKAKAKAKAKTKSKAKTKAKAKPKVKMSRAETGLVGIKLYDTGLRVIGAYGTPDDIQAVTIGGASTGPGGGGAGPGGAGPGGPGAGPMGAGPPGQAGASGGGGGNAGAADSMTPPIDDFSSVGLFQGAPAQVPGKGGGGGAPGAVGPSGGGPGAPGAAGPSGGGGGAQAGNRVVFTRWIYKRGGSRYGFIIDKFNHVVEIEAIGLSDGKVRTARGVGFGANFATILRKYGAPDGYEISGNSIVIRYLVRSKVAFRLNRLGQDKPHVVTGVVVAAGKA